MRIQNERKRERERKEKREKKIGRARDGGPPPSGVLSR